MGVFSKNRKSKIFKGDKRVKKAYKGTEKIYSAGNTVTYYVDGSTYYQEDVDSDASCLLPTTFTPFKVGWTFIGWREDKTASPDVLKNKIMVDEPVELYAVFSRIVTLEYEGNGQTDGSVSNQNGARYYNASGSTVEPSFVLKNCGYTKTYYKFTGWSLGQPGTVVTLSETTKTVAQWELDEYTIYPNSGIGWSKGISNISVSCSGDDKSNEIYSYSVAIDVSKWSELVWIGQADWGYSYGGGGITLKGGTSQGGANVFNDVLAQNLWGGYKASVNKRYDISNIDTLYLTVYVSVYSTTDNNVYQSFSTSSIVLKQ